MDEVPEQVHESPPALRPDGLIGSNPPIQLAPADLQLEEAVPQEPKQPVAPGAFEDPQVTASQAQVLLSILIEVIYAEPQQVALDHPPHLPVGMVRSQDDGLPLQVPVVVGHHHPDPPQLLDRQDLRVHPVASVQRLDHPEGMSRRSLLSHPGLHPPVMGVHYPVLLQPRDPALPIGLYVPGEFPGQVPGVEDVVLGGDAQLLAFVDELHGLLYLRLEPIPPGLRAVVLEVLSEAYGVLPLWVDVVACDEALGVDEATGAVVPELPRPRHLPPSLGQQGVIDGNHAVPAPPGCLLQLEELQPSSVQLLAVPVVKGEEPVQAALVHGVDLTGGDAPHRRVSARDEAGQVLLESFELVPGEYPAEEVGELLYDGWVAYNGQHGIINNN